MSRERWPAVRMLAGNWWWEGLPGGETAGSDGSNNRSGSVQIGGVQRPWRQRTGEVQKGGN